MLDIAKIIQFFFVNQLLWDDELERGDGEWVGGQSSGVNLTNYKIIIVMPAWLSLLLIQDIAT